MSSYMKKKVGIIIIILFIGILGGVYFFYQNTHLEITNIELINFNEEENTIHIKISRKESVLYPHYQCIFDNGILTSSFIGTQSTCDATIPAGQDYKVWLQENNRQSEPIKLNEFIDPLQGFKFIMDKI